MTTKEFLTLLEQYAANHGCVLGDLEEAELVRLLDGAQALVAAAAGEMLARVGSGESVGDGLRKAYFGFDT